ncbi:hypothetical protein RHDC4_01463 [Rhodocyclaceae bacterium]|nr:hypothetical protein RHDC4_01463 [Rhodocyclaceae bacterium]
MTMKSSAIRSSMKRMDAHIIAQEEYEEIPELTAVDLRSARLRVDGVPATRQEFSAGVKVRQGEQRVSIMRDTS